MPPAIRCSKSANNGVAADSAQMLKVGAQVGRDATALEKFRRPERGAPVSYRYSFEDLLALLHGYAPAKVDAVALSRRRVEHGHLSVGLKIHCLGDGISSLLWWKVLEERKKFSMSTTTNTPTPRCALCCPRWAVLVRRYSFLSVSSTLLDLRFSVTRKSRSRYALQGDLTLVVRHCWR
jgi:hypothetical protein